MSLENVRNIFYSFAKVYTFVGGATFLLVLGLEIKVFKLKQIHNGLTKLGNQHGGYAGLKWIKNNAHKNQCRTFSTSCQQFDSLKACT